LYKCISFTDTVLLVDILFRLSSDMLRNWIYVHTSADVMDV